MKKKNYKILSVICVLCMLVSMFAFTGCGNDKKKDENDKVVENVDAGDEQGEEDVNQEAEEIVDEESNEISDEESNEISDEVSDAKETDTETPKQETVEETKKENTKKENSKKEDKTPNSSDSNSGNSETEKEDKNTFKTGTYSGSHKQEAMGSELKYTYSFTFGSDGIYSYTVRFNVGGTDYSENETGTYSVNGTSISLTNSEGTSMSGTISGNKISITRCVSSFSFDAMTITVKQ